MASTPSATTPTYGYDNRSNDPSTAAAATSSPSLDYTFAGFIKGAAVQNGSKPGFSHAMKLSYHTIDKNRLSVEGSNSLTYRYELSEHVPKYTLGLLTALMDELSTDACFRVGSPCPPGVSLQMQTELVEGVDLSILSSRNHPIDIVNAVTKLGRTISHTRTDYVCGETGNLLAFSSHVKYMPTGSRILDAIFNSPVLFGLYERFYLRHFRVPYYDEKPLFGNVIHSHLEFHGLGRATFHITREHTNPFGAMHGGCHAMVMETVAESFAKAAFACDDVSLQAMQIDFLGAAKGSIDVICESIPAGQSPGNHGSSLQVRVLLKRGERICSEGKLRFIAKMTSRL